MVNRNKKSFIFLNELKTNNDVFQRLFENIAMWLQAGSSNDFELQGTEEQLHVIKEAIFASKKFQNVLFDPASTLQMV